MLVLTACGTGASDAVEAPERRDAPPIEGPDTVTGEQLTLAQFAGKPVIVNFWASWCTPCKEELPALQEFADKHPEAQVLGINFMDNESDARELQAEIASASQVFSTGEATWEWTMRFPACRHPSFSTRSTGLRVAWSAEPMWTSLNRGSS